MKWFTALVVSAFLGLSALATAQPASFENRPPSDLQEVSRASAPVLVDGEELFQVRGIKAFPADRRAEAIATNIKTLARDPSVRPDSIVVAESDDASSIVSGEDRIMSVYDADAELEGVNRRVLAKVYAQKISNSLIKFRSERTPEAISQKAIRAFFATIVLILFLFLATILYRRLNTIIETRYRPRVHALSFRTFEIIRGERIWITLWSLIRALRFLIVLALLYTYLCYVLGLFPWTRLVAVRLMDYVVSPLGIMGRAMVAQIPNFFFLAILIFLTRYGLKVIKLLFAQVEAGTLALPGFEREFAKPTYNIIRLFVLLFAAVMAYPYIPGSDTLAFKGISIFLGVMVSLGSTASISNVIAGYTVIYRRLFKPGDRVKIGEFTGDIVEVRLQVTTLRTIKNEEVLIPNSFILNNQVVNYSLHTGQERLILHTSVGIGYDVPWRQVHALLRMAAERTEGLLRQPPPFILQTSLNQFDISYELNAHTDSPHQMTRIYSELHKNIQDAFNEYGVQIMTPAYERDPRDTKTVPKEKWYSAPAGPPSRD